MRCMHDLAVNNKENHDTTACCHSVPKELIISLDADCLAYTDSGPPEPKIINRTSPGPDLPTGATPQTRSVLGGPSS